MEIWSFKSRRIPDHTLERQPKRFLCDFQDLILLSKFLPSFDVHEWAEELESGCLIELVEWLCYHLS